MDVTAWAVRGTVALSLLPPNPHSAGRPPRVRPWAAYGRRPSARTHDLRRPPSVTLHQPRRPTPIYTCSEADVNTPDMASLQMSVRDLSSRQAAGLAQHSSRCTRDSGRAEDRLRLDVTKFLSVVFDSGCATRYRVRARSAVRVARLWRWRSRTVSTISWRSAASACPSAKLSNLDTTSAQLIGRV